MIKFNDRIFNTVYITVDICKHNGMITIKESSTDYKMRFSGYTRKQAIEKAKSDIRSTLNDQVYIIVCN